jgi:preprotein translocase subunit SecE
MSEATTGVASWPGRLKSYFEELQHEMKLVTWPSWKQVRATTGVVLAAVFAFGAYFFVIDNIISKAVQRVYDTFTK